MARTAQKTQFLPVIIKSVNSVQENNSSPFWERNKYRNSLYGQKVEFFNVHIWWYINYPLEYNGLK